MSEYGTDPEHLFRSDAPDTSIEAALSVDTTYLERLVHKAIESYGRHGCIAADLLGRFPHLPYSSVTARFAALERKGFISCGPDKRRGPSGRNQRVMRSGSYKVSTAANSIEAGEHLT
jgi:hypothetical protein